MTKCACVWRGSTKQLKVVESASWANRFLDIQAPLIQDRMASESVDCNVTEKELAIPGENKKLDTKQDGTVDKRHLLLNYVNTDRKKTIYTINRFTEPYCYT